jgi:hypothetical protein
MDEIALDVKALLGKVQAFSSRYETCECRKAEEREQ